MERYFSKNEIMNLINNPSSIISDIKNIKTINNNLKNNNINKINDKDLKSNNSTKSNSKDSINQIILENSEKKNNNHIKDSSKLEDDDFSILKANFFKNSLLQFTKREREKQISGITIPWFYFGMIFSSFCWHTEDLYLYSLNYLHDGSPKIWYGIPIRDKEKMDEYIKSKYYGILLKQPDLIHRLTVHIDPIELRANGINVFRVVQNPGDMILTLPKAYHTGFSTGLNMAEAINLSVIIILLLIFSLDFV